MRSVWLVAAASCAVALSASGTASAANVDTTKLSDWRQDVAKLREKVDKKFGREKGGLDILRWGVGPRNDRRRAKTEEVKSYAAVLDRFLHPPAPVYTGTTANAANTGGTVSYTGGDTPYTGGGWVIPTEIVMCESGGSWDAHNPSGAFGPYQLMPEHFNAGGACDDLSVSQDGQHQCAARLWNGGAGRSNWVC